MKMLHTSVVPAHGSLRSIKTCHLQYRMADGSYTHLLDDEDCPIEFLSDIAASSIARILSVSDSYPRHGWKIVYSDGMHKFI